MDPASLRLAVEVAFERTSRGLARWDDPHPPPDRVVADEEYSRVTSPAKWRIIGARAEAWLDVLAANDLATIGHDAAVEWEEPPGPHVGSTPTPCWQTRPGGRSGRARPGSGELLARAHPRARH